MFIFYCYTVIKEALTSLRIKCKKAYGAKGLTLGLGFGEFLVNRFTPRTLTLLPWSPVTIQESTGQPDVLTLSYQCAGVQGLFKSEMNMANLCTILSQNNTHHTSVESSKRETQREQITWGKQKTQGKHQAPGGTETVKTAEPETTSAWANTVQKHFSCGLTSFTEFPLWWTNHSWRTSGTHCAHQTCERFRW